MKVDVLQVEDAKFKRFSWWSNWVDVAVFTYDIEPYLMQMRVNRFNGKQFRTINMLGSRLARLTLSCSASEVGDLMPMKRGQS